ncbi:MULTISPECIES: peptidoglycan recognition protein family protein [unclassified Variovorax]|uniref:peptidoglycan recognition protein family protein n=1 Tax=unclassified Variovorax TaxID=663243 RepID=UPI001318203B|nr:MULTISPECIES: peptidoglycan recognition family protein [unclassified Variovorax]VTU42521.1 N-acetylmuramoyl-L-alanine amidase [Variovorax sp. SRS16]VTU42543.1 N-acetylmuramoyl-L-alanine amidase [Variovorax sp. PBL-E5]VTU43977.1 N-acetylmuramoyl-L-alanine amidase [Variovorax sp. PBL-H6]
MAWKVTVDQSFDVDAFDTYCHSLAWTAWRPSFLVVHNTGVPTLAQRPNGFTKTHMGNFATYYRDKMKWSAGPHLFIDDKRIWVFTPLTMSGVHSPSWNKQSLGIEMLGDFDRDAFDAGRGLKVRHNTVAAMATLCAILGLEPMTTKLHREDPETTHACPGTNVRKLELIADVQDLLATRHQGEHQA